MQQTFLTFNKSFNHLHYLHRHHHHHHRFVENAGKRAVPLQVRSIGLRLCCFSGYGESTPWTWPVTAQYESATSDTFCWLAHTAAFCWHGTTARTWVDSLYTTPLNGTVDSTFALRPILTVSTTSVPTCGSCHQVSRFFALCWRWW